MSLNFRNSIITIFMLGVCLGSVVADNIGAVKVGMHNGAPTFLVNGKPEFPMFLFEQEVLDKDAVEFQKAGFDFYSCIELRSFLDIGWKGDYTYDFKVLDKVLKNFDERFTSGYLLPRIHVWAPKWWLEKHPEERVKFSLGDEKTYKGHNWDGMVRESFASMKWREEAGEGLRQSVRHIMESPYADRVMGVHIANAVGGEWHYWNPFAMPDESEPMQKAFGEYVRKKYDNNLTLLRKAWSDPDITFEAIRVPSVQEQQNGDLGMFRDPSKCRKVIDYFEAFHNIAFDAIEYFCKIVKEESNGKLMTCVLYSYAPTINWPVAGDHRAAARAQRSEYVDMFATPHTYSRRGLGDDGACRNFIASMKLHGKLFLDESDDRTHLSGDLNFPAVYSTNINETISILRRAFANVVCHGIGMWYMDHSSGQWYNDPAIYEEFGKIKKWADYSMKLDRSDYAEVAVITSMESGYYHLGRESGKDNVTYPLYRGQIGSLHRSGVPFDRYLIEDLVEGIVPDHKVYIFLDSFYLSDAQRQAVEKLKSNGRSLVWFYAPGFVTDKGISLDSMKALTGIDYILDEKGGIDMEVKLNPRIFKDKLHVFGTNSWQSPAFYVKVKPEEVWGRYTDHGYPAVAAKDHGTWRSIYCAVGPLPDVALRKIFKEAGVHVYCETDDNLYANKNWVGLHCSTPGHKKIVLKNATPVYDVFNDKLVGESVKEIEFDAKLGDTFLFTLTNPEKLKR